MERINELTPGHYVEASFDAATDDLLGMSLKINDVTGEQLFVLADRLTRRVDDVLVNFEPTEHRLRAEWRDNHSLSCVVEIGDVTGTQLAVIIGYMHRYANMLISQRERAIQQAVPAILTPGDGVAVPSDLRRRD